MPGWHRLFFVPSSFDFFNLLRSGIPEKIKKSKVKYTIKADVTFILSEKEKKRRYVVIRKWEATISVYQIVVIFKTNFRFVESWSVKQILEWFYSPLLNCIWNRTKFKTALFFFVSAKLDCLLCFTFFFYFRFLSR